MVSVCASSLVRCSGLTTRYHLHTPRTSVVVRTSTEPLQSQHFSPIATPARNAHDKQLSSYGVRDNVGRVALLTRRACQNTGPHLGTSLAQRHERSTTYRVVAAIGEGALLLRRSSIFKLAACDLAQHKLSRRHGRRLTRHVGIGKGSLLRHVHTTTKHAVLLTTTHAHRCASAVCNSTTQTQQLPTKPSHPTTNRDWNTLQPQANRLGTCRGAAKPKETLLGTPKRFPQDVVLVLVPLPQIPILDAVSTHGTTCHMHINSMLLTAYNHKTAHSTHR